MMNHQLVMQHHPPNEDTSNNSKKEPKTRTILETFKTQKEKPSKKLSNIITRKSRQRYLPDCIF